MTSKSIIFGSIDGISKKDFTRIKPEVQKCFDKVNWKDGRLTIKSEKRHTKLKVTIEKIAEMIAENEFGALIYVGNETVACIYLGHKQISTKKFIEPTPPSWWGGGQLIDDGSVTSAQA